MEFKQETVICPKCGALAKKLMVKVGLKFIAKFVSLLNWMKSKKICMNGRNNK